ncbi:MAG: SagB/ThcOx family dehydrogenase [Acidobacteria bacterium]|nr:SagB/ThcOx family dehydrogenase [Acidobacteriota bacterium]
MIALRYHEQTKHHFHRFARSLGYLDWATQPDPFRRYPGAELVELPRERLAGSVRYPALFDGTAPAAPLTQVAIGEFLRCSVGLSAWKQYGASRWALRVNPSSGNLHPTETYVLTDRRVWHYAPREHALEERAVLDAGGWDGWIGAPAPAFLVALASIHWREAWKYGERAFRYCQHDAGHALGALRLAAALLGWRLALLPRWSDGQLAAVLGLDRDRDFGAAEREEPECVAAVTPGDPSLWADRDPAPLVDAARQASWRGTANHLSARHVPWPIIDEVAAATRYPGIPPSPLRGFGGASPRTIAPRTVAPSHQHDLSARAIILQRRSALAFDAASGLSREALLVMLRRLRPEGPPWDAIDWPPQVHLALFVHRVEDLEPGVYAYLRDPAVLPEWKAAMRQEFLWHRVNDPNGPNDPNDPNGLFLLAPADCRRLANRVSCDQDIAEDGFFSLGMIARLESSLLQRGEWFYRRLFWECGLIGQVLYLEAETTGGRATGIGCFYDDPVHEVLGLTGHAWQSLYHFSMGVPVEDVRLTSEPGYEWEATKPMKTR